MMAKAVDVVIIGGGIVGLTTARHLRRVLPAMTVALVEKENALARHQTGNNSGVIHAGIYYKPGSLRAKLCVEGLKAMYKFCDEHSVAYRKCGKLIVATEPHELSVLRTLFERATQNAVPGIQLLERPLHIAQVQPHTRAIAAIYSPETGIVDYGLVARRIGEQLQRDNVRIITNFPVDRVVMTDDPKLRNTAPVTVASTATQADRVAQLCGGSKDPTIVPFRGEYLLLRPEKTHLIRTNIYPVPDTRFPFLGVHFTPRMNGDIFVGPNAVLALSREGYRWGDVNWRDTLEALSSRGFQRLAFKHVAFGIRELYQSIYWRATLNNLRRFVPSLTASDLMSGPAGVRAQALDAGGQLVEDFVVERGVGRVGALSLHVRNAPSPAATSSFAIARLIVERFVTEFPHAAAPVAATSPAPAPSASLL